MSKNLAKIIFSIIELILPIFIVSLVSAKSVDYSVTVEPALNITTTGDTNGVVTLDLNPETHSFDSKNLTVTVGTNNETGYKLYVNTTGNTTNLVEKNDSNLYIETLASEVSENNFTPNRWGYKLNSSSTNYIPFVSGTLVNSSNTATAGVSSTLTFGAKANYDTKAGSYALALNFQATANPQAPIMQNLDASLCTTTPTTVIDSRDDQEYQIARLADGNCWMVSNLNLAGGTKLYSDSSDVPSGYPESGGTEYYQLEASSVAGFSDDTQAYVYNSGNKTDAQSDCTSSAPCNSYYSWISAVAGNKTNVSTDGGQAPYSICPKGWRLPTATTNGVSRDNGGYTGGDFYRMVLAVTGQSSLANGYYENSATFYNNAGPGTTPNFLLAGRYNDSSFNGGGSHGYYWSSSSRSSTSAYDLGFSSGDVLSAGNYNRRYGISVRCVLNETMQDFSSTDAAAMSVGSTRTLTDSRDGQAYTVAKLADNKVWMLDNLRLGASPLIEALSTSNTNMSSAVSFTLPSSTSSGAFSVNTPMIDASRANDTTTNYGSGSGRIGVYYNYCAASAGTFCDSSTSSNATYDICPAGWRLPTGGPSGESQSIYAAYSNNYTDLKMAFSITLSGTHTSYNIGGGPGVIDVGVWGNYWSSSFANATEMHYLSGNASQYIPHSNPKSEGYSVRCIKSNS